MSNKTKMERDGIRYAKMHSKGAKTDNLAQDVNQWGPGLLRWSPVKCGAHKNPRPQPRDDASRKVRAGLSSQTKIAQERGIMSEHKDHDWEITSREAGGEWWKCRVCGELFFLDYDEIR